MMSKRKGSIDPYLMFLAMAAAILFGVMLHDVWDTYRYRKQESTISLYNYDGHVVRKWKNAYFVRQNDYGVFFDHEGRRITIRGGIVITE